MKVLQMMPFYDLSKCASILHELAAPMRKAACSRLQRKLRRNFQMDELSLVPADPLPLDILHGTHPVHEQDWAAGVRHPHTTLLEGRVRCFTPKGVLLDTGQEVPADLVVYCTGFKQAVHIFDATVVQRLRVADDGLYLYRGILHPDVDDLAFIGCGADTLSSLQTAGLQARWLASLLQGSLHLPSRAAQHADLTAQQVWRRSFFPAAHNRAARYVQYTVDYHAQLTRDMSCSSGQQEPGLLGTCLPCLARPVSRCPAASPQPCSLPSATTPNACQPTQQHPSPLGPRLAAPTIPVGHVPPSLHALYATWQLQPQPQHQAQPQYDQLAQHGGNRSTLGTPPHLNSPTLPAARSDQDPGASCYSPAAGLAAGLPLEVLGHAGAWVNEQGLLSLTSEAGRSLNTRTQLAFGHGGCEEIAGQCAGHAMQSGHWSDKSAAARSAGTMQPLSPVMEGYTTGHASPLTPVLCQEEASAAGGHWGGAVQQDGWPHVLSPAPHLPGAVQPAAAAATTLGTSARGAWARARAWAVGTASARGAAGHAMAPALPPTAAVPPPASMQLTLAPADPDTGTGLGTHISLPDSTMPNQATASQRGGRLAGSLSLPQPGSATKPVSQAGAGRWIRSAIRRALWASASSLTPTPSSPASCLPARDSAFSPDLPHSVSNGSVTPSTWTAFMSTSTSNARAQCQAAISPTTQHGWNSRLSSHPDSNQVACSGRGQPASGTSAQGNQADPPLCAAGGRGLGDSGGAAEDRPTDQPMPLRSRPPLSSSRSMRAPKDSLSTVASGQLQPGSPFTAGSHQLGGVTQNHSRENPAEGTILRTESHGEVIYPRPRLRQARGYDSAAGRTGHPSTAAADAGQEDGHDEEADENAQAAIMRQLQQRTHSAQQLAMYVMASSAAQQRTSRRTSRALSRARSITGRFGAQSASTEGQHSVGDRIRCQQTSMSFTAGATPGARTLQHNFMQARRSRLADVSLPGSPPSHNSSTSSLMVERGAMSTFNSSFTHSTLARRVTLTAGFTVAIQAADAAHPVLTSHQTTPARAAPVLRHTSQPGNQGLQQQQQAALGVVPLQQSVLSRAEHGTPYQGSSGREVTASSLQADPLLHHSHQHHDHSMGQAQAAQAQAQAAQAQLSTPSAAPASPAAVRSCFAHVVALPAREQALAHASGRTPASVAEGGEAHTSHTTQAVDCGALHLAAQGSAAAAEQRELGLPPLNGHVPKL
ncbi:hypothetical protein QJQ45_015412 [Haematococcus lacustris]|nr:hypothetical protein QJQ45_015412 [Haematococcus lacustris]